MMSRDQYFKKNKGRNYTDHDYATYCKKFYRDVHGVDLFDNPQQPTREVSRSLSLSPSFLSLFSLSLSPSLCIPPFL